MCKYEIYFYSVCLPFCPYKTGFVTFSKTAEQLALKFTHKIRDSPRIIFWVFNSFLKFVCLATYLSLKTQKAVSFQLSLKRLHRLRSNTVLVGVVLAFIFFFKCVCLTICQPAAMRQDICPPALVWFQSGAKRPDSCPLAE